MYCVVGVLSVWSVVLKKASIPWPIVCEQNQGKHRCAQKELEMDLIATADFAAGKVLCAVS